MATTERDIVSNLQFLFDQSAEADEDSVFDGWPEELKDCTTATFKEDMVLTTDKGLVLRLDNGQKFYITVKEA